MEPVQLHLSTDKQMRKEDHPLLVPPDLFKSCDYLFDPRADPRVDSVDIFLPPPEEFGSCSNLSSAGAVIIPPPDAFDSVDLKSEEVNKIPIRTSVKNCPRVIGKLFSVRDVCELFQNNKLSILQDAIEMAEQESSSTVSSPSSEMVSPLFKSLETTDCGECSTDAVKNRHSQEASIIDIQEDMANGHSWDEILLQEVTEDSTNSSKTISEQKLSEEENAGSVEKIVNVVVVDPANQNNSPVGDEKRKSFSQDIFNNNKGRTKGSDKSGVESPSYYVAAIVGVNKSPLRDAPSNSRSSMTTEEVLVEDRVCDDNFAECSLKNENEGKDHGTILEGQKLRSNGVEVPGHYEHSVKYHQSSVQNDVGVDRRKTVIETKEYSVKSITRKSDEGASPLKSLANYDCSLYPKMTKKNPESANPRKQWETSKPNTSSLFGKTKPWNGGASDKDKKARKDGLENSSKDNRYDRLFNVQTVKSSPTLEMKCKKGEDGDNGEEPVYNGSKASLARQRHIQLLLDRSATYPTDAKIKSLLDGMQNANQDPDPTATNSSETNNIQMNLEHSDSGISGHPDSGCASPDPEQTERKEETLPVIQPANIFITQEKLSRSRRNSSKQSVEILAVERDSDTHSRSSMSHIVAPTYSSDDSLLDCSTTPGHSRTNSLGSTSRFGLSFSIASPNSTSSFPSHFVVVAIDFGTTFSGYAFSFTRDPDSVHMMRRWEGGDPGIVNQKTPTTLLLTPDGTFHSFGFTARDYYHDLDAQESKRWLYFEKFKMALHHNADLNKDTTIKASNGKPYSALAVFSHALRYFKEHALQELTDQSSTTILNEDIRWVLTVPAIWKAPAKQFMRQAAYQAGIANPDYPNQLLISLEPEAASIYVRKLRLYQLVPDSTVNYMTGMRREPTPDPTTCSEHSFSDSFVSEEKVKYKTLPSSSSGTSFRHSICPTSTTLTVGHEVDIEGTRYMVVDCGGGTVDITVYEMESSEGLLKELHKATGGPYGSLGIDLEFEMLLVGIFGSEFIEAFKVKRPSGWVDLMTAFESRKRTAHPDKHSSLNVALPFSFIDYYKKCKGGQVDTAVRKFANKEVSWSSQGMLRLTPFAMKRLFQPTLDRIKQAIGDVLNNPNARDIKFLFLVGGFAESGILQLDIRKEFGHLLKIIIPQDVGLTILKGAVCFGLDPTVVSVRRCRLTYGVGVLNRFVPDKHPKSKMVVKEGVQWCMDVFDKFVEADQPVTVGNTAVRSYAPAKPGQKSTIIHIYCSEKSDVRFITDPGVRRCGTLCLDLSDVQYHHGQKQRRREIQQYSGKDEEVKIDSEKLLSPPVFVPIKFDSRSAGSSSSTEAEDSAALVHSRSVRFSKLSEVRQLTAFHADDAVLARMSYAAYMRAVESRLKAANKLTVRQIIKIAVVFSFISFFGNLSYQQALKCIDSGVVNIMMSTSALFTLVLASVFPATNNDRFTLSKLVAVAMSIGGFVLMSFSTKAMVVEQPIGVIWSILGALLLALFLVLLRRLVDNEEKLNMPMFYGFLGFFTLVFLWPGLLILHFTNTEKLEWPDTVQWTMLVLNGITGMVISNLLWLWGCFLTSSLAAALSLSLTIPMSSIADIFFNQLNYNWMFYLGLGPVFVAYFAVVLLSHYDNCDPVLCLLKRSFQCIFRRRYFMRLRDLDKDKEQSESLIGVNSDRAET